MSVYSWDLTAGNNATSDSNIDWSEGQLPSTVNNSARAMMAALKAMINDQGGYASLGGTGNTFTLSLSQTMSTKVPSLIGFFATRGNTGAVTMNVDSTGAYPLRAASGTDLASGQLVNGSFYIISWNASTSEWIILNAPPLPSYATISYVDSSTVSVTGDTMTGVLNMNSANNLGYLKWYNGATLNASWGASSTYPIYFQNSAGTAMFYSDTSGNITAAGNVTGYSDERLKVNIQTIEGALETVKKMRGVTYTRRDSGIDGLGVVAQEVQALVPRAVQENGSGYLSVAYGNLVGLLIEAIKDLSAKVEELEAR